MDARCRISTPNNNHGQARRKEIIIRQRVAVVPHDLSEKTSKPWQILRLFSSHLASVQTSVITQVMGAANASSEIQLPMTIRWMWIDFRLIMPSMAIKVENDEKEKKCLARSNKKHIAQQRHDNKDAQCRFLLVSSIFSPCNAVHSEDSKLIDIRAPLWSFIEQKIIAFFASSFICYFWS